MTGTDPREWDDERWARAIITTIFPADSMAAACVIEHGAPAALRELLHLREGAAASLSAIPWLSDRQHLLDHLSRLPAPCTLLVPTDTHWPTSVDDLPQPPVGLWVFGDAGAHLAAAPSVAIVGARAATSYGIKAATNFAADIAAAGWPVVSGGAFGIDAAAHRGALTAGTTICVLACGVDVAYPAAHRDLLSHIAANGLIVSEVGLGQPARRYHFLARNRIIAALAHGTVLVEAAFRSGSLSTARVALELCRYVMAVPGPISSAMSAGVHELLRSAPDVHLVSQSAHVLELCERIGNAQVSIPEGPRDARDALSSDAARLIDHLGVTATSAPVVAAAAQMSVSRAQAALAELHVCGLVAMTARGWLMTTAGMAPSPR